MGTAPGDGGGGHGGTTDGGRGGTSGSGGGAGGIGGATVDAGSPADKFVHHWVFDSTGVLTQTCPNMPVTNTSLAGDFIDVVPGTTSDLVASYYCPWNLNLVASDKTKASIVAGQSCVTPTTMAGVTINMHGDAFDFTTSDGLSATVSASFTGQYSSPSLTCTFKVTGKLAPMP
jgi:hypothetical protein